MQFASRTFWAVLILMVSVVPAELSAQIVRLQLGKGVQGDLSPGRTYDYSVPLEANQYVRAAITQPVAAVVVELDTPDGKKALEVDTRNFAKPCRIVWIAETAGEYRIRLSVPSQPADVGHYEIKLEEVRPAGADDRQRVEAERLFTQGNSEARTHAFDQAALTYVAALGLYRQVHDREREGDTLKVLGDASDNASQTLKAIGYYEQALAIEREIKDRQTEGNVLNNMGNAYFDLSQYEKAIAFYEQALEIDRQVKDRRHEGGALGNLGNSYSSLSRYEKAIGYYEQALAIYRELKNRGGEAATLGNLGIAYAGLSQNRKAIVYYEQGLAIDREIGDRVAEGFVLANLGDAYTALGEHQKAIEYQERALAIHREFKDRAAEGNTLSGLGTSFGNLNQYEKAISYYEQALEIYREIKDRAAEGASLNNLAEAHGNLGRTEKAADYYSQALLISREVKDRRVEAVELTGLMQIGQVLRQPRLAIFYGKQAVNVIQSIRADIRGLDQEARKSFLEGNRSTYRTLTDVLVSQGRLIEAQQALALLNQQEFFDYAGDDAIAGQGTRVGLTLEEADWAERYRKGGDALAEKSTAISDLQDRIKKQPSLADSPDTQRQIAQLQVGLETGSRNFQQFLGELKLHFEATPDATATSIDLKVTEALKTDLVDLKHGAVAIYTLVTPDRYVAILV